MSRMIEHDLYDYRYECREKPRTIANLIAIDLDVPSGSSMDQLISKDTETRKDNRQSLGGVATGESKRCSAT